MKRFSLIIGLIFIILISCSSKTKWKSEEELISEMIEVINQRNTQAYLDLFDFDRILTIWREESKTDEDYKEILKEFDNEGEIEKIYSRSYNGFITVIEKHYRIENFHFEIMEYKIIETQKEENITSEKYNIKLKDNYKNYWNLVIYITKLEDHYFMFEPIDVLNLKKIEE